jgi:hypothetical protein
MTSYQSRLQQETNMKHVFDSIATITLTLGLVLMALAYAGAKTQNADTLGYLNACYHAVDTLTQDD